MQARLAEVDPLCKTCNARPAQRECSQFDFSDGRIHFPGSRQYGSVGEIENQDELNDAAPNEIVKVIGTKEATAQAAEQLQVSSERAPRVARSQPDYPTRNITVANRYYHALADQPTLIRSIRGAGGNITIPQPAPPKPVIARPISDGATSLAAKAARIDLDAGEEGEDLVVEGDWELRENTPEGVDGELDWIIRAKEDDLEKAVAAFNAALDHVKAASHSE